MADESGSRSKIIAATKTPLGFYTLIILVVEGLLGYMATKANGIDFTILLISMIGLVIILIVVVLYFAIKHPEALTAGGGSGKIDVEVRLVFDKEPKDLGNAVAYYEILSEPFTKKNKLIVNPEERNEAYVTVPQIRADDKIRVWLHHDGIWYATENITAGYRRLKFFVKDSDPVWADEEE